MRGRIEVCRYVVYVEVRDVRAEIPLGWKYRQCAPVSGRGGEGVVCSEGQAIVYSPRHPTGWLVDGPVAGALRSLALALAEGDARGGDAEKLYNMLSRL
ncbi:hypothetical protein GCM10007981_04710 [Thermocladium modestius]|uniref:Uncharacterized protein n=1 Tax=Thermocladium modestius TaxID=62609 RepID=A0A830GSJ6_9CREN|nr:hypothetical protein [Thermocladium modestius]GGP19753.1 hypothetical protein GCM10007981_04710 [Thermocladium modestius]